MSKILGVDTSTIDNISSLGSSSGGIAPVPATTDTGIVMCPQNSSPQYPFSAAELADYSNLAHMFQLSDITGVVKMVYLYNSFGALKSNGDFFVGLSDNGYRFGLSSSNGNAAASDGGMKLSLSGVAKVTSHNAGYFAIKTDGTLWFCGSIGNYINSAAIGGGTVNAYYGWDQIGSDTDWHDITAYVGYPYQATAIKGASGSRYLYATGYGTSYNSGQGNTSRLTAWTRVKSSSGTDLAESMSVLAETGYANSLAESDSGKLFSWGENGYGTCGTGNTTDVQYATQVGTATNWDNCWLTRQGGFAKNTLGEMYMSTSVSSWRIEPNTNKVFTKINNDTDYEDLRVYCKSQQSAHYNIFAKKGGSWYVSYQVIQANGWAGNTSQLSNSTGWVALNTVLQQNDITGDIDEIMPYFSNSSSSSPAVMFALS